MANEREGAIVTPLGRWMYPHLFTPRAAMVNGKSKGDPRYELEMLFDPADVEDMKETMIRVARAKWPEKPLGEISFPLKSGASYKAKAEVKGRKGDHYEGKLVLRTRSQYKPQVVDSNGQPILDQSKVYGGCYGYASVNFVAFDGNGSNIPDALAAYINFAMVARDGERIGSKSAKEVFSGVIGKMTSVDPTGENITDDEIPF